MEKRNKIKFWEDKWMGNIPLSHKFSRLYTISNCKNKTIKQFGEWNETSWE